MNRGYGKLLQGVNIEAKVTEPMIATVEIIKIVRQEERFVPLGFKNKDATLIHR